MYFNCPHSVHVYSAYMHVCTHVSALHLYMSLTAYLSMWKVLSVHKCVFFETLCSRHIAVVKVRYLQLL